jgi:16S rRNA processing protein RimM
VPEDRIQIGQLRSAYGLNGWLWVYSNTEPMSNMFDYLPWYIETKAGWQTIDVKRWKPHGKGLVVALKGVNDRTEQKTWLVQISGLQNRNSKSRCRRVLLV